jgi:hypothetical protein
MVFSKFLLLVGFLYGAYYIINILMDLAKAKSAKVQAQNQAGTVKQIVHPEENVTEKITDEYDCPQHERYRREP